MNTLLIYESFGLHYACLQCDFTVQLPNGLTNLKEIEEYIERYIKAGLPSYKEPVAYTR